MQILVQFTIELLRIVDITEIKIAADMAVQILGRFYHLLLAQALLLRWSRCRLSSWWQGSKRFGDHFFNGFR